MLITIIVLIVFLYALIGMTYKTNKVGVYSVPWLQKLEVGEIEKHDQ